MASERYVKELVLKFRRRPVPEDSPLGLCVGHPEDVWRLMRHLIDEPQEVFCVLHLNAQNILQSVAEVSRGTLSASLVHPREIFRGAIMASAAHLVLVHNHPSGDPTPSGEDVRLTRQLCECARLMDLRIHDHVIIGDDRFVSLAQRGIIGIGDNGFSATKADVSIVMKPARRARR
ncbi:MAG TPA: DNA repair protein RadC [Methylomirabilota bacterium]|nr:DNA repair protein RadC [Methylomirabilota bacterium]